MYERQPKREPNQMDELEPKERRLRMIVWLEDGVEQIDYVEED